MPRQNNQRPAISLMDTSLRLLAVDGAQIVAMKCPQCGDILASCSLHWWPARLSAPSSPKGSARAQIEQLLTDSFGHLEHVCPGE